VLNNGAEAYNLKGGQWNDANQLTFWLSSTISQAGYNSHSIHGSTAWNASQYVNVTEQSSATGADVKWYASFTDLGDFYADTLNYSGSTPCWNCTYTNSVIRWNKPVIVEDELNVYRIKETATHEFGHTLGLGHENDVQSIMIGIGWLYGTYPVADDWNGIDAIYSN
jgi:predicted Zn-dependent protease